MLKRLIVFFLLCPSAFLATGQEFTWDEQVLRGSDWSTVLSDISVALTETGQYTYDAQVRFRVDTPVAEANDENYGTNDVVLTFTFYEDDFVVTSFRYGIARECGRHVVASTVSKTSEVSWPLRRIDGARLGVEFYTDVTGC